MTVKELREELEGVPDDATVLVCAERTLMMEYGESTPVDALVYNTVDNTFTIDI